MADRSAFAADAAQALQSVSDAAKSAKTLLTVEPYYSDFNTVDGLLAQIARHLASALEAVHQARSTAIAEAKGGTHA